MEKRNVVIYVAGMRFSLSTTDSDEYVIEIGEKVDRLIKGVQKDNPKLNRDACATLVALDICDDETKLFKKSEALREQVKDYVNEIDRLTRENERLKAEIEDLKSRETKAARSDSSDRQEPDNDQKLQDKPIPPKSEQKKHGGNSSNRHTAFVGKNMKNQNAKRQSADTKNTPFNVLATPESEVSLDDDLPFQFSFFDNEGL